MVTAKDILAQTDLALLEPITDITGFYFIAAHTDAGTRLYSEAIANFEMAEKIYNQYIDVIKYFDGGNVQLYRIDLDGFDIVAYTKV